MATVFLKFTRCDPHRLPRQRQKSHLTVLCRIIGPLRRRNEERAAQFVEEKVLFFHENALAHTSALSTAKMVELGYGMLLHVMYLSDLARTTFIVYKIKKVTCQAEI